MSVEGQDARQRAAQRANTPDAAWGIEYGWDAALAESEARERGLRARIEELEASNKAIKEGVFSKAVVPTSTDGGEHR